MRLAHVALWTRDLEGSAAFWQRYFGATLGAPYHSKHRPGFVSIFVSLPQCEAKIELMTGPWLSASEPKEQPGWDHLALSLEGAAAVDALAARCEADGLLLSPPRTTGDGFYEAVVRAPDGLRIEITA